MKFYSDNDHLKYPWDSVVRAFWRRYPNAYSRHVLHEDTIFRRLLGESGLLFTKKFIVKTNPLPRWARHLGINITHAGIVEETMLDLKNKLLISYTRNVNHLSFMSVEEKVIYKPDPDNPRGTQVSRSVWISSPMKGVSHLLEKFGVERFKHNSANTIRGLKQVLKVLYEKEFGEAPKLAGKVIGDMVCKVKGEAQKISKTNKEVLS